MARPASTHHPLREIRRILGVTQKAFAETISIAPVTLKKIEAGELAISDEVASRIFAETEIPLWGLNKEHLERLGRDVPLTTWDGRSLSRKDYEQRKEKAASIPPERIDRVVKSFKLHIQVMLEAACEVKNPSSQLVFGAIQAALNRIREDFDLGGQVDAILATYGFWWAPGYAGQEEEVPSDVRVRRFKDRKDKLDFKKGRVDLKKLERPAKKPKRLPA